MLPLESLTHKNLSKDYLLLTYKDKNHNSTLHLVQSHSKQIKDCNVRPATETVRVTQKRALQDSRGDFLKKTLIASKIKAGLDKWHCTKLKRFFTEKEETSQHAQ